jgi:Glucose-1-phosphate thymidylyltransferase (EC 2.7.7.24)
MKAVILAGGSGTRLYPTTKVLNKHLLPIYNKPMIYYPLSLVMLLGIRDIAIVVNPQDLESFKLLLKDGSHVGINITYIIQEKARGLAEGLILAKDFIKDDYVLYLLGDNIFFGHDLPKIVSLAKERVLKENGASIFAIT